MYGVCQDDQWRGNDWVEIYDGSSTQRYPGCGADDPTPGTVTGTTITVKLYTSEDLAASGFFAVVSGGVTVTSVTSDLTCES